MDLAVTLLLKATLKTPLMMMMMMMNSNGVTNYLHIVLYLQLVEQSFNLQYAVFVVTVKMLMDA